MTMFTKDTLFKEWITYCKSLKVCSDAILWMENVDKPNLTFGEAMSFYVSENERQATSAWAIWAISTQYKNLDNVLRENFIKKIKDHMSAFQIYIRIKDLSIEDIKNLKIKFKGKLPQAERELEQGIMRRRK